MTTKIDIPYLAALSRLIQHYAVPLLLPASLAMFFIRLRGPRPMLRRLSRQPGFASSAAVALIVSADLLGRIITQIAVGAGQDVAVRAGVD